MSDSYRAYGLLLSQIWEDASLALVTRPAGAGDAGLLYGADRLGHRHLLAPISSSLAVERNQGDNLVVEDRTIDGRRYLDLSCTSDALSHIFASLADQIVRRSQSEDTPPFQVLQRTLGEWRQLLKPSPALTEDEARGLFGEMIILLELARRNPGYALSAWTGPDGDQHDFTSPRGDLEVKSARNEGRSITVSSLFQVDPPADRPLVLARLHVESSPNGRNIRDLMDALCAEGIVRDELVEKLAGARYIYGDDPDTHRFQLAGPRTAWTVDDNFPSIRASDIPAQRRFSVRSVKYTVDLAPAGEPMPESDLDAYLDRLVSA